jgi:hypothetical protein
VRHDKKELLDKVKDMPLLLRHKLTAALTLDAYDSHAQALINGKKFMSRMMLPGQRLAVYLATLSDEKCASVNFQLTYFYRHLLNCFFYLLICFVLHMLGFQRAFPAVAS